MALTWQQAVRQATDDAVAVDGVLRTSIPGDVTAVPDLADVSARLEPGAVRRWMVREVWKRQPSTRLRPLRPPDVDESTAVAVTPGPLLWCGPAGDRVELGLGDRVLSLPAEAAPLVDAVLRTPDRFTLAALDVPLDVESRVVVGRRLAVEGVIAPV